MIENYLLNCFTPYSVQQGNKQTIIGLMTLNPHLKLFHSLFFSALEPVEHKAYPCKIKQVYKEYARSSLMFNWFQRWNACKWNKFSTEGQMIVYFLTCRKVLQFLMPKVQQINWIIEHKLQITVEYCSKTVQRCIVLDKFLFRNGARCLCIFQKFKCNLHVLRAPFWNKHLFRTVQLLTVKKTFSSVV